jgi:hypothetical protein
LHKAVGGSKLSYWSKFSNFIGLIRFNKAEISSLSDAVRGISEFSNFPFKLEVKVVNSSSNSFCCKILEN